jgi:hypothetical protein
MISIVIIFTVIIWNNKLKTIRYNFFYLRFKKKIRVKLQCVLIDYRNSFKFVIGVKHMQNTQKQKTKNKKKIVSLSSIIFGQR